MKLYDVTLTCDHKVLVWAANVAMAEVLADEFVADHGARHSTLPGHEPVEVSLDYPVALVVYPGPFSMDAIEAA